jgi:hypothetical protein
MMEELVITGADAWHLPPLCLDSVPAAAAAASRHEDNESDSESINHCGLQVFSNGESEASESVVDLTRVDNLCMMP